jgi:hypothetical protein
LVNGTGNAGDVWLCNVAGTVDFGPPSTTPITFAVGDYAVYTGTEWARSSGATGTVTSVGVSRDGNALTITGSPVTSSGTINLGFSGDNTQYINGAGNLTTFPTLITSIGLTMPAAFGVSNSPLTANGTIGVTALGFPSQYIRGDGTLADFPTSGGGGSSVSYYFNGGTSQGTIGGTTYYEMSKTADTGTGVDFNKTGDGFIVAFLTDANDPNLLQIPAGNWDFEIYASMSSNGGTPELYAELYKYDGTTFTLIATSSHEILYDGVNLNLYSFATAVPQTSLTVTDRLAIKLYADNSGGKTTTIHTQDSHLCQVITTFTTGLTALNGLTAQVQYFGTGTSGNDFNIVSSVATHTFNIPSASATARGLITTGTQTIAGSKTITGTTTFTGGPILSDTNLTYANSGFTLVLQSPTLSVNRTVTLPNGTGTLALISDLSGYVDLTTDQTIGGTKTFSNATKNNGGVLLQNGSSYSATGYMNLGGMTNGLRFTSGLGISNYLALPSATGYTYTFPSASGTLALTSDLTGGTVTSVGLSAPTGFSVSGSPVTSSGTLALSFASGYSLPTNVKQSNWDDAYTWVAAFPTQTGNTGKFLTTDGSSLSWVANPLGTVTSVDMSVPTGLSVSGNPITTSGTLAVTLTAGYSIPTTANQSTWTTAYNRSLTSAAVTGTTTKILTLNQQDGGTITASWTDINTDAVTSVFGRTGAVVATEGDYTLTQLGDVTITSPSSGQVLKYNGTFWINDTDANTGTVTSVAMTVPTGLSISGSPITSSGTLAVTLSSGYVIPTQSTLDGFVTLTTSQTITGVKTFSTYSKFDGGIILKNNVSASLAGYVGLSAYSVSTNKGISIDFDTYSCNLFFNGTLPYSYTFPNATGTLALTSDLASYLPLAGGTLTGPLGGTSASFSSTVQATGLTATNTYSYLFNLRISGNDTGNTIYNSNANIGITSDSGYRIFIGQVGSSTIGLNVITTSGNVGIGIVAPNAKLTTYTSTGANLEVIHSNAGTFPKVSAIGLGSDAVGVTYTTSGGTLYTVGSAQIAAMQSASSNATTDLVFYTTSGGSVTEKVRIASGGATTFTSSISATSALFSSNLQTNGVLTIGNQFVAGNYCLQITPSTTAPIALQAILAGVGASHISLQASGGNVGIGISVPLARLHIKAPTNDIALRFEQQNDSTSQYYFNVDSAVNGSLSLITNYLGVDYTGFAQTRSGNVGIGTTSPGYTFDVNGNGHIRQILRVGNGTAATNAQLIINGVANKAGRIQFQESGTDSWLIGNGAASENGNFEIYNANGQNALTFIKSTSAASFYGSVTAPSFFESSDNRLKTLIQDNYQTKGIASITPKLYTKNGKVELGYYAQDFVGVLDNAISKGSDEMLSLSYREVHTAKIYALEQRIKELEFKLN